MCAASTTCRSRCCSAASRSCSSPGCRGLPRSLAPRRMAGRRADVRQAHAMVADRRGRARRARERARHPAPGSNRRRRVAVGVAERARSSKTRSKAVSGRCGACGRSTGLRSAPCCRGRGRDIAEHRNRAARRRARAAPAACSPRADRRSPLRGAIWRSPLRSAATRASRARRRCSSHPTCCTCWRQASGSEGSPVCCSPCPRRPASLRAPSAAGCCSRTLSRFSPLALSAVIVIATTGVVQAYIDVRSFNGLLQHHLRRADHRQDRAPAGADRPRLDQPSACHPGARTAGRSWRSARRRSASSRGARCAASWR